MTLGTRPLSRLVQGGMKSHGGGVLEFTEIQNRHQGGFLRGQRERRCAGKVSGLYRISILAKSKKSQLVAIGFGWERSPARLRPELGERGVADEWAPAISGPRR